MLISSCPACMAASRVAGGPALIPLVFSGCDKRPSTNHPDPIDFLELDPPPNSIKSDYIPRFENLTTSTATQTDRYVTPGTDSPHVKRGFSTADPFGGLRT